MLSLSLTSGALIAAFVLGVYSKIKFVYIITDFRGLTYSIIGIYFSEKEAKKFANKIKFLTPDNSLILVTKYRTNIFLNKARKNDKNFVTSIYEVPGK